MIFGNWGRGLDRLASRRRDRFAYTPLQAIMTSVHAPNGTTNFQYATKFEDSRIPYTRIVMYTCRYMPWIHPWTPVQDRVSDGQPIFVRQCPYELGFANVNASSKMYFVPIFIYAASYCAFDPSFEWAGQVRWDSLYRVLVRGEAGLTPGQTGPLIHVPDVTRRLLPGRMSAPTSASVTATGSTVSRRESVP